MKRILSILLVVAVIMSASVFLVGCEDDTDGRPQWGIALKNPETGEYVTDRYGVSMTLKYTGRSMHFYPKIIDKKTGKDVDEADLSEIRKSVIKDGVFLSEKTNPSEKGDYSISYSYDYKVDIFTYNYSLRLTLTIE